MSELTQFDSEKSMIRYLPPNGTAGLARTEDRIERRSPSPPARISAIVRFTRAPSCSRPLGANRSTGRAIPITALAVGQRPVERRRAG